MEAWNSDPNYLMITWPGRLIVLGAGLIGLMLVGLVLSPGYYLIRSRGRDGAIVVALVIILIGCFVVIMALR